MIDRENITQEWINRVSVANRKADKILVEKVIRAFLLLEGLVKVGIPFVFKGGTSLMLHFQSTKRLSIDIDIIIAEQIPGLETRLDAVAKVQGFLRQQIQPRITASGILKQHHQFFYTPVHRYNKEEDYVLLDILFEKVNYNQLHSLPIQSSFLPADENPLLVSLPGLEDILGDKLTAFAPNTTGVPYLKKEDRMSMEIIKQLYDIGNLADVVEDIGVVNSTFHKFVETELAYRQMSTLTSEDVLNDIFQTSLSIVSRGTDGKGNFKELQDGIRRIQGFIFSEIYHIEKAIVHASKAAWLSILIKYNINQLVRFISPNQVNDLVITTGVSPKLNRLKKTNPEAFYYWYKISEIINSVVL